MANQTTERERVRGYLLSQGERYDYFEIWSPSTWQKQMKRLREAQDNAEYFSELDLFTDESDAE